MNEWCHCCGVEFAADDRRVYLNGGNKGTDSTSAVPTGMNRTALGSRDDNSVRAPFDGYIGTYAVWNAALTDDEVRSLGAGNVSPLQVRAGSLVDYVAMNGHGGGSDEPNILDPSVTYQDIGSTGLWHEPPLRLSLIAP